MNVTQPALPQIKLVPTPRSKPFWDALNAHRVDIQQCDDCGKWIFFPRMHCTGCFSQNLTWKTISGTGTLLTYTIARVPTMPQFADQPPQQMAVVQFDEGPHINTTLVDMAEDAIRIGMRVKPVFDDVEPGEVTLLRYTAG